MPKLFFILFFLIAFDNIFGQVDTNYSYTECTISINKMTSNEYIVDKYGFNVSGKFPTKLNKYLDIVSGVDFNMVSFFLPEGYPVNHFISYRDVNCHLLSLETPLSLRIHTIGKIRYFVSAGFYGVLNLGGISEASEWIHSPSTYSKNKVILATNVTTIDYGTCADIGCIIPFDKKYLILKTSYNYGLRTLYVDHSFDIFNRYISAGIGIGF